MCVHIYVCIYTMPIIYKCVYAYISAEFTRHTTYITKRRTSIHTCIHLFRYICSLDYIYIYVVYIAEGQAHTHTHIRTRIGATYY